MAQRTTTAAVQLILGSHYGPGADGENPSLQPYVDAATDLVDRAVACAAEDDVTISSTSAELMERWLAAWYYTIMDPLYQSRSTLGASGSWLHDKDKYLAAAKTFDPSGCLASLIDPSKQAGGFWAGKTTQEQLSYEDRGNT